MGAMKELYIERNGQSLHRLIDLKAKLSAADALADTIRSKALRDYSSDEPYENAVKLSAGIASALSMVESMLDDMGAGR